MYFTPELPNAGVPSHHPASCSGAILSGWVWDGTTDPHVRRAPTTQALPTEAGTPTTQTLLPTQMLRGVMFMN